MPLPTIEALATDAAGAVSDLLDESEWDDFDARTPLERVQWRYCHADCDLFAEALSAVTDWPIVGVSSASHGPLHRLVQAPDGRMVDVMGFVTEEDLRRRYGGKPLSFGPGAAFSMNQDPEDLVGELQAFLHLDTEPFNTAAFRAQLSAFIARESLDADAFAIMAPAVKGATP